METKYLDRVREYYRARKQEAARELVAVYNTPYSGTGELRGINKGTRFALAAWNYAKTEVQFEIEASLGNVRLRILDDEFSSIEDYEGDTYDPSLHPGVKAHVIRAERKRIEERIEQFGLKILIGEFFDGQDWIESESEPCVIGDEVDYWDIRQRILEATLEDAMKQSRCPCCGRVKIQ